MIFVHELAVTIRTFHPTMFAWDLQVDARMPAFAAVTGHLVGVNDLGFWRLRSHLGGVLLVVVPGRFGYAEYERSSSRGQVQP